MLSWESLAAAIKVGPVSNPARDEASVHLIFSVLFTVQHESFQLVLDYLASLKSFV